MLGRIEWEGREAGGGPVSLCGCCAGSAACVVTLGLPAVTFQRLPDNNTTSVFPCSVADSNGRPSLSFTLPSAVSTYTPRRRSYRLTPQYHPSRACIASHTPAYSPSATEHLCPRLRMSSLEAPMRLTRSRSRSQTRITVAPPVITTTTVITSERKRRPTELQHNGYTAEEEDQASKFLKIDEEEDEQHDDDVSMQPASEAGSKKRSRSRSKGNNNVNATTSKKQKEQQPGAQQPSAVQTAAAATPPPPSPSLSSTHSASSASRASLQPPGRNSSSSNSGSSTTQRSRSHSNVRPTTPTSYIAPELLSGGRSQTPASSTSSTASLQPPATAATAAKRRPSVPNLPSQTRTSSSASSSSSSSTAADAETTEFRLQLTLERLSQLRRQLGSAEGAAQLLDLLKQVEDIAYNSGHTVSVSRLSAVHNQLLSAMRQLAEQTAGVRSSVSVAAGRLLDHRIVPRSVASIMSSHSLLSQSLPSLITTNLPLSHKLLLINPAAVHQQDADGFTALHYAVLNNDLPLIAYLCEHGANPAAQNNSRASPLALARLNSVDTSVMIRQPAARCSRAEAGGLTNIRQDFLHCITCDLTGERGCCEVCGVRCHKGHVLQPVMPADKDTCNEGFCDCPDLGTCQASDDTQMKQRGTVSTLDAAAAVLSGEEDSIFSTINGTVNASNARSMLRLMEDVIVSTAELMKAAGGGEEVGEAGADAADKDDESITWNDVWQASALTALLTLSFYAILGGAPDIVHSATPAMQWLQQRWQLLTAAVSAIANSQTKHRAY